MARLVAIACLAFLSTCARSPEPPPVSRESDPMYQEAKRLIEDQSACFKKESYTAAKTKADLETAAYSVIAKCVGPTQSLKSFQANHNIRNVSQMQQYWAEQEKYDLETVKQMIALIRTH
jgi:hypothetical protein